jgi:asparagine synthase (glutamine-hydrolysing)
MCGIYGMVSRTGASLRYPEALDRMGHALAHRGPDGHAVFTSTCASIGTERLRIVDLHVRADQPFAAPSSQVWLECNGEIYNARTLRAEYPEYPFRSESDVEAILPLYLHRGTDAIPLLDGMFGLAIWDNRTKTLILARDRAGEKPLFYARLANEIWFASELQSLLQHPQIGRELDRDALDAYLKLGYVPEPWTMFRNIRRVEAGTFIRFSEQSEQVVRYWDPGAFAIEERAKRNAIRECRVLLEEAVTKQIIADVPVGVFVSGGLDSSILATLAARTLGPDRVHTFSAQFTEDSYDESGAAAKLMAEIGTRHVPVRTDEETLREALDHVINGVAEPLADPAILPTFLLARAARRHVKVILSGEGADELFGGYPTYIGHKLAPMYDALPAPMRAAFRTFVGRMKPTTKKVTLEFLLRKFVTDAGKPWSDRHFSWFGSGLSDEVFADGGGARPLPYPIDTDRDPLTAAMLLDYRSYLRDNLLVKVDRATMLSSVEARAPFLDRDVTKFALSLPPDLRVRRFETKWLLKKAAEAWLPREVIYRRKRGLSVPVASWLNHGLRPEVDRLLDRERLRAQGFVNAGYAARLVAEHRTGVANHARPLWALLMLQFWFEKWGA